MALTSTSHALSDIKHWHVCNRKTWPRLITWSSSTGNRWPDAIWLPQTTAGRMLFRWRKDRHDVRWSSWNVPRRKSKLLFILEQYILNIIWLISEVKLEKDYRMKITWYSFLLKVNADSKFQQRLHEGALFLLCKSCSSKSVVIFPNTCFLSIKISGSTWTIAKGFFGSEVVNCFSQ